MSKFYLNVCLPPTSPQELRAALDAVMAPFDINFPDDEWNPNGEWDWWHIDAGDEGGFAVGPEFDGDPRLIFGTTSSAGRPRRPLRCDGGPRGLLDFEATKAEAVAEARARWQAEQRDFARLVADHPSAEPLSAFLARHRANPRGYPREQAVADHHAQPLVRALSHRSARERYPNLGLWVLGPESDPISCFTRDLRADLDGAASWALATTALLTLDGQWTEADRPGPFTHVLPGEEPSAAYARQTTAYLDGLHEDCIVVRMLCHC
ncbi:hypothetical protein [Streptomyces sp. AF1A]|uniref:hypothetical protein n=1 Tax=Streptomyces sp. AF1A TaxID=3394350 RepID=UPI0039BCDCA6